MKEDIDLAHSFDIEWIGIFFGTSDLSLKYKFGINKSEAIKKIIDSVKYAKDKGQFIWFKVNPFIPVITYQINKYSKKSKREIKNKILFDKFS